MGLRPVDVPNAFYSKLPEVKFFSHHAPFYVPYENSNPAFPEHRVYCHSDRHLLVPTINFDAPLGWCAAECRRVGGTSYGSFGEAAKRKISTRESSATLKAWLNDHRKNPYPTKSEKVMLSVMTKMTLTQVSTWFANARRRLKKESKGASKSSLSVPTENVYNGWTNDQKRSGVTTGRHLPASVCYSSEDVDVFNCQEDDGSLDVYPISEEEFPTPPDNSVTSSGDICFHKSSSRSLINVVNKCSDTEGPKLGCDFERETKVGLELPQKTIMATEALFSASKCSVRVKPAEPLNQESHHLVRKKIWSIDDLISPRNSKPKLDKGIIDTATLSKNSSKGDQKWFTSQFGVERDWLISTP